MAKDTLLGYAHKMREAPTKCEEIFEKRLINAFIKYRKQVVISNYIVDFVINNSVIEIDGSSHDNKNVYDAKRDKALRKLGYKVIHIKNQDVEKIDMLYLKTHTKDNGKDIMKRLQKK